MQQEHSNLHWHTDNCSKHTCHATCNCKHALSTSTRGTPGPPDPTSRPASVHPAAHVHENAHTHTRTCAHTHTHTHSHSLFTFSGTRAPMCSPTSCYPRHRRVLHHTSYDRWLCSVCSFSSVLNGNVGCSAHLRTAAERHTVRV